MFSLLSILKIMVQDQKIALLRGGLLAVCVLIMGTALLALSGWFITAAATAGLAGAGLVFDVFRPSAMVRLLALGRAGARYGERLLTHDATLKALESLRLRLLHSQLMAPFSQMTAFRSTQLLNRIMADIDTLDGLPLRLFLPLISAVCLHVLAFFLLAWLVGSQIALWISGGWLLGALIIFLFRRGHTNRLSHRREAALQSFRTRLIDMIAARRDLAIHGRLQRQKKAVELAAARRMRPALDHYERLTGAGIMALGSLIGGGALWLGLAAVQTGSLEPAYAALAFFAAISMGEAVAPMRRAGADLGKMISAATRVRSQLAMEAPAPAAELSPAPPLISATLRLAFNRVTIYHPGSEREVISAFNLRLHREQTIALIGPSGGGKSTILHAAAGLISPNSGQILMDGSLIATLEEDVIRARMGCLPQRSTVMAGTIAENLLLADPSATEEEILHVLALVGLEPLLARRKGLETRIGHFGEGLSGGEIRRLALARTLLRKPEILLLDEPTEGLDEPTAICVLQGIRKYLPDAAILMASHRRAERNFADLLVRVG